MLPLRHQNTSVAKHINLNQVEGSVVNLVELRTAFHFFALLARANHCRQHTEVCLVSLPLVDLSQSVGRLLEERNENLVNVEVRSIGRFVRTDDQQFEVVVLFVFMRQNVGEEAKVETDESLLHIDNSSHTRLQLLFGVFLLVGLAVVAQFNRNGVSVDMQVSINVLAIKQVHNLRLEGHQIIVVSFLYIILVLYRCKSLSVYSVRNLDKSRVEVAVNVNLIGRLYHQTVHNQVIVLVSLYSNQVLFVVVADFLVILETANVLLNGFETRVNVIRAEKTVHVILEVFVSLFKHLDFTEILSSRFPADMKIVVLHSGEYGVYRSILFLQGLVHVRGSNKARQWRSASQQFVMSVLRIHKEIQLFFPDVRAVILVDGVVKHRHFCL